MVALIWHSSDLRREDASLTTFMFVEMEQDVTFLLKVFNLLFYGFDFMYDNCN